MWGLDPGYRDLFVATNQLGEKLSCSTREFNEDARYTISQKKREVWQGQHVAVSEAVHHMPTKKTTSLASLERYVRFMIPRVDILLDFYMIKPFRKLRLRSYIYAKNKLRALCLVLTEQAGQRTVVGFGNWSNNDTTGRNVCMQPMKFYISTGILNWHVNPKKVANCGYSILGVWSCQKYRKNAEIQEFCAKRENNSQGIV